ncbi:hypothetical protein C1E23_09480 [Pseudoalteromonas phenolica]|uniref:OmpR/PhoB-type domain-containing protein n=1 Tax=Pseudoalteromonas phenolica TaxID=161398 RepID=A0A4Q7IN01_9GAMM|nr:winged helix-turn-helix domain-containing protein [Pseudoalteromonas phenolica]RZQ53300.1 hypothetical protein C1E23_09480 [Pseudoalteromonas phenolica]
MPSIQFGCFEFNQTTQILSRDAQPVELDPRQLALLEFFIANPERIVTRDELQTAIWKQVIVSDNAINKLVANLRKSLDDNPKSPIYIQTVPKQGYRFIAQIHAVSPVLKVNQNSTEVTVNRAAWAWPKYAVSLCLFSFVVFMSYVAYSDNKPEPQYGQTQTLTRMTGVKQSPVVMPDQQAVLFINFSKGVGQLFQGAIGANAESAKSISTPFSSITYLLGFDKSGQLIVRATENGRCSWFKGLVEGQVFTITERSELACPQRILRDNEYDSEADTLYFINHGSEVHVENSVSYAHFDDTEFKVATINLANKWSASRFEIKEGDVALLAHTAIGHSGVFTFDLTSIEFENKQNPAPLTPIFTLPFRSNNIAWSHDKQGVVYTSAPPATQLFYQSLEADVKPKLVASFSDYICCNISRIGLNDDYIFTTEAADFDIEWLSLGTGQAKSIEVNNSSSYDFIPTFANTSDDIYFFSKRTGKTQVYKQSGTLNAEQVSDFNAYFRFYGLALSPDDKWITSFESKVIWLLATDKSQADRVIPIKGHILAVDWLSNQLFAVSVRDQGQIHIEIYNTQLQKVHTLISGNGANISRLMSKKDGSRDVVAIVDEQTLYSVNLSDIFDFNDAGALVKSATELLKLERPISYFAAVIDEQTLYYPSSKRGQWYTLKLITDAEPELLPVEIDRELAVKNGKLLHSKLVHLSSEVHRTLAQ